jgi:hypothetical protein
LKAHIFHVGKVVFNRVVLLNNSIKFRVKHGGFEKQHPLERSLGMAGARKGTYKITNWRKYNESLVQRGSITFWFSEETVEKWRHDNANHGVGHPYIYSDTAIECLLILRELFQLPYRQTEGLSQSLVKLMQIELSIPDYTSLSKRAAQMEISLDITKHNGPIDVVVDSTGLKVFGEGEWKMRQHGKNKRRTWRKLHLAVNPATHEIEAETLTENSCHDADQVDDLLDQATNPVSRFYGDGVYDNRKTYKTLSRRLIRPIIPPRRTAKIWRHESFVGCPLSRDRALREIRRRGRQQWKQRVGYHRRSLSETAMYRMKCCFGDHLKNRNLKNQQTEARLRCKILNKFSHIGLPLFE